MRELPVTKDFYDRTARCTYFLNELKNFFETAKNITDIRFVPILKGYEIEYVKDGVSEKLCINIRSKFYDGLIIKKYVNGKFRKIYCTKDSFAETVNRIFKK